MVVLNNAHEPFKETPTKHTW